MTTCADTETASFSIALDDNKRLTLSWAGKVLSVELWERGHETDPIAHLVASRLVSNPQYLTAFAKLGVAVFRDLNIGRSL